MILPTTVQYPTLIRSLKSSNGSSSLVSYPRSIALATSTIMFQSAYRKHHSTETALLKILDDVYRNAGQLQSTLLIGLDLSAAFDTIDKSTLIARLHRSFGIEGLALDWISSYLAGCSQHVRVGSSRSPPTNCVYGVPKVLSWGPSCSLSTLLQSPTSSLHSMSITTSMLMTRSSTLH